MRMKNHVLSLAVAAFTGCLGGILSTQVLGPETAEAQSSRTVTADRFNLVDSRGVKRASFGLSGGDQRLTHLWMADKAGRTRLYLTVYPDRRRPKIEFKDINRRVVAALPDRPSKRVSKVKRIKSLSGSKGRSSRYEGKADQAGATYGDLRPVVQQLRIIMNKVDELARNH